MKRKKMKLSLRKLTIADLDSQDKVKGGYTEGCYTALSNCCTVYSTCCTVLMATCIPDPEGCNPADTFQGPRHICP